MLNAITNLIQILIASGVALCYGMDYAELSVDSLLKIKELSQGCELVFHHSCHDADTQLAITDGIDRTNNLLANSSGKYLIAWNVLEAYRGGKITTNKPRGSMVMEFKLKSVGIPGDVVRNGRMTAVDVRGFYSMGIEKCKMISRSLGGNAIPEITMTFVSSNYRSFSGAINSRVYETGNGVIEVVVTSVDVERGSDINFTPTDIEFITDAAQQVDSAEASTIAVPPSAPSGSPR